ADSLQLLLALCHAGSRSLSCRRPQCLYRRRLPRSSPQRSLTLPERSNLLRRLRLPLNQRQHLPRQTPNQSSRRPQPKSLSPNPRFPRKTSLRHRRSSRHLPQTRCRCRRQRIPCLLKSQLRRNLSQLHLRVNPPRQRASRYKPSTSSKTPIIPPATAVTWASVWRPTCPATVACPAAWCPLMGFCQWARNGPSSGPGTCRRPWRTAWTGGSNRRTVKATLSFTPRRRQSTSGVPSPVPTPCPATGLE